MGDYVGPILAGFLSGFVAGVQAALTGPWWIFLIAGAVFGFLISAFSWQLSSVAGKLPAFGDWLFVGAIVYVPTFVVAALAASRLAP